MISDERKLEIEFGIRRSVPRDLFIDLMQDFPAAAAQADLAIGQSHTAVENGIQLSRSRQSKAIGLVRHQLLDEVFERLLIRHGGEAVRSVQVESKPDELNLEPLHLTTAQFGNLFVGFASHRELQDAPVKNATRRALCHQNRGLSPDLFHGLEMFNDRPRFVLIMVRRDAALLGKIASMTISVLDSRIETFLFQSDIGEFLAGYGAASSVSAVSGKLLPKLRPVAGSFKQDKAKNAEGKKQ